MLFNLAVLPLIAILAGSAVAAPHGMDASLMARKQSNAAATATDATGNAVVAKVKAAKGKAAAGGKGC
ncbi:hypothetical protein MSAN_00743400 [Mycena sanguinolenta]|uniref:Uncharacterized protein n=1 Tax=Mycena sanguinolenta TaxID=230812 RepID=A0A8H6Z686_9AGAR|nr:hypothetical protein MSAN_00743400 [Mycena sanguinolenta]